MKVIDVFNGDADGICALQQLRLQHPQPEAQLITGVKRDIALLDRIATVRESAITVLDVSLDRNRASLERLLMNGNAVFYADHHYSGAIPESPCLEAHIHPSSRLCTSLIVDGLLQGRFRTWAIAGAYGDDLHEVADAMAREMGLQVEEIEQLREIGLLLNYNGYGVSLEDLLFHPAELFGEVHRYMDPFRFYQDSAILPQLRKGYASDIGHTSAFDPFMSYPAGRVFWLPDAPWARRVVGVFSNQIARERPDLAHATILTNPDGRLTISVRAPLTTRKGADALCRQFPHGGGRAAAAGINNLPADESEAFLALFSRHCFC